MTVRIGHASKDENSRAKGGAAGDQTGKEVCIRNWYRGSWKVLLRAKNPAVAKKIAESCVAACTNEKLGYDQSGRNTGLHEAKMVDWDFSKIQNSAEFDCSSLVAACVQAAGINVWSGGNAPTTRTLEKVLTATEAFEVLTDKMYLNGTDYLQAGDILLNPGAHVVMVLSDGALATQGASENKIASAVTYSMVLPLVKRGDEGEIVKSIQQLLILRGCDPGSIDGEFGKNTKAAVERFQEKAGIEVDGKVGGDTWAVLIGKG